MLAQQSWTLRKAIEQREVFRLHALEDLDYASIARRACVPIGTVRSRIHRARSILRSALAPLTCE